MLWDEPKIFFLERRYFFSIILSEFLKNRVALHEEKIPWGLVPYVQSLLLARYLRGDLDDYPPFLWK